jgi:hypothetical protein
MEKITRWFAHRFFPENVRLPFWVRDTFKPAPLFKVKRGLTICSRYQRVERKSRQKSSFVYTLCICVLQVGLSLRNTLLNTLFCFNFFVESNFQSIFSFSQQQSLCVSVREMEIVGAKFLCRINWLLFRLLYPLFYIFRLSRILFSSGKTLTLF